MRMWQKNDDTQNLVKFRPERPTDLDQPTYQRNQQTAEPEEVEAQPQETVELSAKDDEPEDLEVPTYMRRRRLFGT